MLRLGLVWRLVLGPGLRYEQLSLEISLPVLWNLIDIVCPLPCYSGRNALDFTYSTTLFKMFYVKEAATIRLCQFYSKCLPPSYRWDIRKLNFINGLKNYADSIPSLLCLILGIDDQTDVYTKYNISPLDSVAAINRKVWRISESEPSL